MMEEYNINQTTLKILGLFRNDYRRSLHLRQIARETRVDVKAVQLQLKRLERMNILSSLLKGRNKEYSVNLRNSIAKYLPHTRRNLRINHLSCKELFGKNDYH